VDGFVDSGSARALFRIRGSVPSRVGGHGHGRGDRN
jgi:hypothetical protein